VLFYEQGASWVWVLAGPASAISMEFVEMSAGYGVQLLVPGIFLVLVTGFLAIQIKAARIHTSVELTPDHLRQGTERIRIDDIVRIYPEAKGPDVQKWQSARALGELTGVVAPVLDGEPKTTSVVYSPPLLVLSLFLATVAGVLAVVAIARLRRGQRTPK
jgi:hypothetical protein